MNIGGKTFCKAGHTTIVGILNCTPDSFSDGGKFDSLDKQLFRAETMLSEGAEMIDIGGESTRPGFRPVSPEEEAERVLPVIVALQARFDVPLSLDTTKSEVARAGLRAGVSLINDISGFRSDPAMIGVIAEFEAAVCITHNGSGDCRQVLDELALGVAAAKRGGIAQERIILDPGIGFGKTVEMNLALIHQISQLVDTKMPVLLGVSRKSVIGAALNLPVGEREEGTLAVSVYAALHGVQFLRVHSVKENVRAVRMMEAILNNEQSN